MTTSLLSSSCSARKLAALARLLTPTQVHYYVAGANGTFKIQAPMVLGHESCGIITALPASYTGHLAVGDRVALEVGINCKNCHYCKIGRYNLCKGMRFASSAKTFPHLDGTLCEVMTHPVDLLHKLPPSLDLPLAALAEPLSVVLHAYRRAQLQPGARVLVLGAGAVGLLAAALAKASGATTVVAVDIEQGKLDFAAKQGWTTGTHLLPRGARVSGLDALEVAKSQWEGLQKDEVVSSVEGLVEGFDAVFECTGVESCMQLAVLVSDERWDGFQGLFADAHARPQHQAQRSSTLAWAQPTSPCPSGPP